MKQKTTIVLLILMLCSISLFSQEFAYKKYQGKSIKKIQFEGLINTDETIISSYITLVKGTEFDYLELREIIKGLYSLRYFEDIEVDAQLSDDEVILTFIFTELPIINDLEIIHNALTPPTTADIKNVLSISAETGSHYDEDFINQEINSIVRLYESKGYENTQVTVQAEKVEEGKVNLKIRIFEGNKIITKKINIIGLKTLDPKDVKQNMLTKETRTALNEHIFDPDKFELDKERIMQTLKNNGFVYAKIIDIKIKKDWLDPKKKIRKGYYITIILEEGEQYTFGDVTIEGNKLFEDEELLNVIKQEKGEIYNDGQFQQDLMRMKIMYSDKGYINAQISPIYDDDKENLVRNVKISIYESVKVHINNIIIRGNERTKTYVIDRELEIKEGSVFSYSKILRSRQKLMNTEYFKVVVPEFKRTEDEELIDLEFIVEEQLTGLFKAGITYSTIGGITGFFEMTEKNLMGHGWDLQGRLQFGLTSFQISAGTGTDWLFKYEPVRFNVGFGLSWNKLFPSMYAILEDEEQADNYSANEISYQKYSLFIYSSLGYLFFNFLDAFVRLDVAFDTSTDIKFDEKDKSFDYKSLMRDDISLYSDLELGWRMKNAIKLGFAIDRRDLHINTTQGFRFYTDYQLVGFGLGNLLGLDDYFYQKFTADFSGFVTPFRRNDRIPIFVLAEHTGFEAIFPHFARGEIAPKDISEVDKSYFNGVFELRGWNNTNNVDLRSAGFSKLSLSAELQTPIIGLEQILWFVGFFDAGTLMTAQDDWGYIGRFFSTSGDSEATANGWKFSTGFGLRLQIPMIPMRLYFAHRFFTTEDSFRSSKYGSFPFDIVFSISGFL